MLNKTKIFLEMIKFEHSIFALPFAFMGALLASFAVSGTFPSWATIGWITLAMVGARSAAMGLNRVIDRIIDAKNPRTANRAIPKGLISGVEAAVFIVISFAVLFVATSQLTVLAMQLLPIAVFFLVFYSYTKRFTWLCHIFLGITLGLAPLGGWVAVAGYVNIEAILLFLCVAAWSAGFDVIYACQDIEFDQQEGIHSIPARFGVARGLMIARGLHVMSIVGFFGLTIMMDLSIWYVIGATIAAFLLFTEHRLVSAHDLSKLNTAFFTMNGILSCVVFAFTFLDLVVS